MEIDSYRSVFVILLDVCLELFFVRAILSKQMISCRIYFVPSYRLTATVTATAKQHRRRSQNQKKNDGNEYFGCKTRGPVHNYHSTFTCVRHEWINGTNGIGRQTGWSKMFRQRCRNEARDTGHEATQSSAVRGLRKRCGEILRISTVMGFVFFVVDSFLSDWPNFNAIKLTIFTIKYLRPNIWGY